MNQQSVAIAGGGPIGLMLALMLAKTGAKPIVLEKGVNRETGEPPSGPTGAMGLRSVNVSSGKLFAEVGLIGEIRERALWWFDPRGGTVVDGTVDTGAAQSPLAGFIGHFSGIGLNAKNLDPALLADTDIGEGAGAVGIGDIVNVLEAAVLAEGVELRKGVAVENVRQSTDGAIVDTDNGSLAVDWVVGCDGGRSVVRKTAGFGFPGTDAEYVGRIATVAFVAGGELPVGDWVLGPNGSYVHAPAGRLHVVEYGGNVTDRDAPVTIEELCRSFEHVSGKPLALEKVHAGLRYTDAARQVDSYRKDRVLLAGDAAHVHSPAGGQGLNQGLDDVACLAPLLAAVVNGAGAWVLDAYDRERRPVGAAILDWTRAQTAAGRPDPNSRALRGVLTDLLDNGVATAYVLGRLSGDWGVRT